MIALLKNKKATYTLLVCLLSFEVFSQTNSYPATGTPIIYDYSPGLTLQRNTAIGGYTQGIQTKLQNGDNNWFFGNLDNAQWMVAKGDYQSPKLVVSSDGNVGIGTTTPTERLELQGKVKINNGFSEPNNESGFRLKFYDNGGVNNDAGLGLSGSGEGNEVMWLNAKAGFRFINGTDGDRLNIIANGNLGIGTATPKEKLSVNGKIRAHEIKVETADWPDYVFEGDYKTTSLTELEKFIKKNKHLPEMPSAKEAETNGVELGEMNKLLLKKIEELTLHLIEKDKEVQKLNTTVKYVVNELEELKKVTSKKIN